MDAITSSQRHMQRPQSRSSEFGEESDGCCTPLGPRHRLMPKVSSDYDQHIRPSQTQDLPVSKLATRPPGQLRPDPHADDEVDSILCNLMRAPHEQLDVQSNSALLRILEAFLDLKDDLKQLQQKLKDAKVERELILSRCNMAEKDWGDEKQDFKDEIKRLEIRLAKISHRGVAEVTLARQGSKLRARKASDEDQDETIFEFFGRTFRRASLEDRIWNTQRGMSHFVTLAEELDRLTSQRLEPQESATGIHADLALSTPSVRDVQFSLANALGPEACREVEQRSNSSSPGVKYSAPDHDIYFSDVCREAKHDIGGIALCDSDPVGYRVGSSHAVRHSINPSAVMPLLLDRLDAKTIDVKPNPSLTKSTATQLESKPVSATTAIVNRSTVMAKASGFFQRLRPQHFPEISQVSRRLSFEPGDDLSPLTSISKDHTLRKSVSLDSLLTTPIARHLTGNQPISLTRSPSAELRAGLSSTPSPADSFRALARPRHEREDSASSLLTAIKRSDACSTRSSSSVFDTPCGKGRVTDIESKTACNSLQLGSTCVSSSPSLAGDSVEPYIQVDQFTTDTRQAKTSSDPSLEHTNAFRGNLLASAAARAAVAAGLAKDPVGMDECDRRTYDKLINGRNSIEHRSSPDVGGVRKENALPIGGAKRARKL